MILSVQGKEDISTNTTVTCIIDVIEEENGICLARYVMKTSSFHAIDDDTLFITIDKVICFCVGSNN
jgi:hypothetical protein